MENYNLKEWKEHFNNGEFEENTFKVQVKAGWYDWFCKDTSLRNKTKKLGNIVRKLNDSEKIYVWFKNNCPMVGPLYDDFRLADVETGNTLYTTTVDDAREEFKYAVYGKENGWTEPLISSSSQKEIVAFLNQKIEEINGGK